MFIYWSLFVFFAAGALAEAPRSRLWFAPAGQGQSPLGATSFRTRYPPLLIFGALLTVAVIGLRYQVGADWLAYIGIFQDAGRHSFSSSILMGDPGYQAINWLVRQGGYQIWLVNLISAAIFGWGLLRFCSTQPRPWLAFAIAVPYLVIVVAMGYTRQAIALGVLMAGLAGQAKGASAINFAIYAGIAALFHATAIVVFPIVAWSARGNPILNAIITISVGILLYKNFLGERMDTFVTNYIDTAYSSQGAFIRVSMNIVAAGVFALVGKKMQFSTVEYKIWRNFSVLSAVMMMALAVSASSTAVDRISLYLIPVQIAVLSRVPLISKNATTAAAGVLAYAFLVEFVWLNFGQFSLYWLPYQFFPFSS